MGYTHYYSFKKITGDRYINLEKKYQLAINDCSNLIFDVAHGKIDGVNKISLSGYTAHSKNYLGVKFNGAREQAHEDFYLRESLELNDDFNFCKTNKNPYDVVVTACLTILSFHLGNIVDVSSDGTFLDWTDGIILAEYYLHNDLSKRIIQNKHVHPINEVE